MLHWGHMLNEKAVANTTTKRNCAVRQTAWPHVQLLQPDKFTGTGEPPVHASSAFGISLRGFSYPVPPLQLLSLGLTGSLAAAKLLCLLLQKPLVPPTVSLDELSLNTERKLWLQQRTPPTRNLLWPQEHQPLVLAWLWLLSKADGRYLPDTTAQALVLV